MMHAPMEKETGQTSAETCKDCGKPGHCESDCLRKKRDEKRDPDKRTAANAVVSQRVSRHVRNLQVPLSSRVDSSRSQRRLAILLDTQQSSHYLRHITDPSLVHWQRIWNRSLVRQCEARAAPLATPH